MGAQPNQSDRTSSRAPHLVRNIAVACAVMAALTVIGPTSATAAPPTTEPPTPAHVDPHDDELAQVRRVTARYLDLDAPAVSTSVDTSPAPPTFAAAIEASGVLTSPSADELEQATDGDLYWDTVHGVDARTQVSAAGNYVSLRTCRDDASSTCGTGWAYVTGPVDGVEMHGGLLGEANHLDLHPLDDRYFVASENSPGAQAPVTAWLIDAVSGKVGPLDWRDEPTTLNSPEQALLLCQPSYHTRCGVVRGPDAADGGWRFLPTQGALPSVVDARDGTIQPLAMPDDVVAGLPVAQHGTGRIWVGTDPDGAGLGLAYSDDGGATWSETALPIDATSGELQEEGLSYGDQLLEIAADGDRVAVALSWERQGDLYVSEDAGQSWTTTPSSFDYGNGAHLYVLADGRLVLMWSEDFYPTEVLVSTGPDWAELEEVNGRLDFSSSLSSVEGYERFSVNRAGIALVPSFIYPCVASCTVAEADMPARLDTVDFSTDLTNWQTIESLEQINEVPDRRPPARWTNLVVG
jgi:hypothetical protein